jgi:peptide/nickel transport system ATP-binding protein
MILEAKNIGFRYKNTGYILKNVDLTISSGEIVGLIAKSGYGKTTFAKIISGYLKQSWGDVLIDENKIPAHGFYPVQLIYQHPEKSINPRWKMRKSLCENDDLDEELLDILGIRKTWIDRYPNELSGGELQRFAIARAISKDTRFLIADEITAMLDGITQAQIWHSLIEISKKNNIGMIVITHNKELVNKICSRTVKLEEVNNI